MFPVSPQEHISFPLATGFPASKSIFSSVGFDSHNPVVPALHKRSVYHFHHEEILVTPEGECSRQDSNLQHLRLRGDCSKPVELRKLVFRFPGQQEQHYLVFILKSNPNQRLRFSYSLRRVVPAGIEPATSD